jgi:hypothetical protein
LISDPLNIILLDTDVFSYLMEPGDPRGRPYVRHVEGRTTALSFITVEFKGTLVPVPISPGISPGAGDRRPSRLQ